jgi:dephospho-CoA kinase
MLKIGVTGGIGSGKSIICKIFNALDIPVFNADIEAKKVLNESETVKSRMKALFGNDIYDPENKIDRQKLSSIIFNDKIKLLQTNSIIHPVVIDNYNSWLIENSGCSYTIMEAALIFEGGFDKLMDYIITVSAPKNMKILRTMQRDGSTRSDVLKKMNNQSDDKMKITKSDFVIYNINKQLVIPQILKVHDQLLKYSNKS